MARAPTSNEPNATPKEYPQVTPRDLHATSDIRFVMHEVGRLTANVDRLIADVKGQGDKIDDVRHRISFLKGAVWVALPLIGLFVAIASFFLSAKWDAAVQALRSIQ